MTHLSETGAGLSSLPHLAPKASKLALAVQDVSNGARAWELWGTLGVADIKHRYRRSVLGPFWITMSMGIMILALGVIYGAIFKLPLASYMPYLAVGITMWTFFSTTLLESCGAFVGYEGFIKQCPMPFSVYVYRIIWRNLIVLAHNAIIVMIIFVITGVVFKINMPLFLVGIAICVTGMFVLAFPLATLCSRFRDVQPLIASSLQLLFFITPILFNASMLPEQIRLIVDFNPVYHIIEVVRLPLIGGVSSLANYIGSIGTILVSAIGFVLLFARFRARIAYWL